MQQEPHHERLLVPWGQVISERDKSGVRKLLHHSFFFFNGIIRETTPMSPYDQLLAIMAFFASL